MNSRCRLALVLRAHACGSRRLPGRGAGRLAVAADPHHGRLRRRRRHRRRHPHRRRAAGRGARPAHHRREQARRRRHHRRRYRREGHEGRLQRADDLHRPHGGGGDDQVAGLRRGEGFRAGRHHRQFGDRHRRAEGLSGERPEGPDRGHQEGAGQAQLRHRRHRLDPASHRRAVPPARRPAGPGGVVPHHRRGGDGAAAQGRGLCGRSGARGARPGRGGRAEADRGHDRASAFRRSPTCRP